MSGGDKVAPADDAEHMLAVAKRVNWYTPPAKVVANRPAFIAQIMARGITEDIVWMRRRFSLEEQREAYIKVPPGLFYRNCWAYWGQALLGDTEALPYPIRFPQFPQRVKHPWPGR